MTTPRWTVVRPNPEAKYADIACDGRRLWAEARDLPEWLAYENWDALVKCVRDADKLRQAEDLAYRLRRMRDEVAPEVGDLLDLLTEE